MMEHSKLTKQACLELGAQCRLTRNTTGRIGAGEVNWWAEEDEGGERRGKVRRWIVAQ